MVLLTNGFAAMLSISIEVINPANDIKSKLIPNNSIEIRLFETLVVENQRDTIVSGINNIL